MEKVRKLLEAFPANGLEYARKIYKIGVFGVKNNMVLVGILLIGYCVIAPAVFITATSGHTVSPSELKDVMGVYTLIAAYVGGLLIPAVMFSYVHKRRDRDFYHSMPVKRGQYFIGYFVAGIVMYFAPYLLMCVIMGLAGGAVGYTFSFVLHGLALYIVVYATTLMSIMFSGSMLSSLVTLAFLNTFPVILIFCSLTLRGYIDDDAYMTLLAPYIYIFTPLTGGYSVYQYAVQGQFAWVIWVQLVIAAAELVLAFIMYKLRRGETTMAVAFPKTRYVLQYGTMFLVALASVTIFSNMWWFGHNGISTESVIWTAIAVFITFVVLNMILEQSFRAAFHKIRHLFVFTGVFVVVLSVIIGIVNSLPYFVIPIKTDAIVIRYNKYAITYDKPADDVDYFVEYRRYDEDGIQVSGGHVSADYAVEYIDVGDENIEVIYHVDMGLVYYAVTDPKQVAELAERISDYKNNNVSDYIITRVDTSPATEETGEYYSVNMTLYTLKPGQKVKQGMYLQDISAISSQGYTVYFSDISAAAMDYFTAGMDMIKTEYREYYY